MTYNSNHIEGSCLTHDETRYVYETNTVGLEKRVLNVDDIVETANHFRCIDLVIENASYVLSSKFIKQLHFVLKTEQAIAEKAGLQSEIIKDCQTKSVAESICNQKASQMK